MRGNAKTVLSMISQIQHGHSAAWNRAISCRFADSAVQNGARLVRFENETAGRKFSMKFTAPSDAKSVSAKI